MKAITIWQPWASLAAIKKKRYETRSWATRYRGPIAVGRDFGIGMNGRLEISQKNLPMPSAGKHLPMKQITRL